MADEYVKRDDVLKLLNRNSITKTITFSDGISIYDSVQNLPAADVVPKSEVEHTLSDLKKEIHNIAVYPHGIGGSPYITLKALDAIIKNKVEEIKNEKEN